ncbi:MAG: helix-turn-helix domain-containing protein [Promethearchaeota archaeon]
MKAIQITRKSPTADEMWDLYRKERDGLMKERYHAIALMHELKSAPKVAKVIGRVRNTVWEWVNKFNKDGLEGLRYKKPPGATSRLTEEEREHLKADILAGPRALGYDFSNWSGKNLSLHIKKQFSKEMGSRAVQKMLKKMGFTRQKPDIAYAKANPEAQVQFKEDLKKRSTG